MTRGWWAEFEESVLGTSVITQETFSPAWRTCFSLSDGEKYVLPIPFGCRRDAEACATLLSKTIPSPHEMTYEEMNDVYNAIGGSGQETVNHLVATCCQW